VSPCVHPAPQPGPPSCSFISTWCPRNFPAPCRLQRALTLALHHAASLIFSKPPDVPPPPLQPCLVYPKMSHAACAYSDAVAIDSIFSRRSCIASSKQFCRRFGRAGGVTKPPISHTLRRRRRRAFCTLSLDMRRCSAGAFFSRNYGARRLFVAGRKFCMQEMGSGKVEYRRCPKQMHHRGPTSATALRICLSTALCRITQSGRRGGEGAIAQRRHPSSTTT
jgi:hypothetical protein